MKKFLLICLSCLLYLTSCNKDEFTSTEPASFKMKRDTIWLGEYNPGMTRTNDGKEPFAIVTQTSATSRQYEIYPIPFVESSNYQQGFNRGGESLIPSGWYICDRWLCSGRIPLPSTTFTFTPDLSQAGWSAQSPGNTQTRFMTYSLETASGQVFMTVKSWCYHIKSDLGGGTSYPKYVPIDPNFVVLRFTLDY